MKRLALVLPVIAALVFFAMPSRADDAPGCEGLAEYREAMFAAAEPLPMQADDNPLTMSSSDWLAYAESSLAFHDRLSEVEPPEWAAEWHVVRLDITGMQEQIGRAAAKEGAFVILGFEELVNDIFERDDETRESAIAICSDFATFADDWDALDGENRDGTPVPTPVR